MKLFRSAGDEFLYLSRRYRLLSKKARREHGRYGCSRRVLTRYFNEQKNIRRRLDSGAFTGMTYRDSYGNYHFTARNVWTVEVRRKMRGGYVLGCLPPVMR